MKTIRLTAHAVEQCAERGATEDEVREAIEQGVREPAKRGRSLYRLNFQYEAEWLEEVLCRQTGCAGSRRRGE